MKKNEMWNSSPTLLSVILDKFFSFKNKTKLKCSDLVHRIFEGIFAPTLQTLENQNILMEQDKTTLCYRKT